MVQAMGDSRDYRCDRGDYWCTLAVIWLKLTGMTKVEASEIEHFDPGHTHTHVVSSHASR